MSKILTQEEIDALLQSARRFGAKRTRTENDLNNRAKRFDFKKQPDYISPDLLTALQAMHEQFAVSLSSSMTMRLRSETDVSLESVRTQSYSEFVYSLSDPTVLITTSMNPLEGLVAIEFNPSVAYPLIDILLGGPGVMPTAIRPISEIESSIFESIIRTMLADLQNCWRTLIPEIRFEITGRESRPNMIHAAQPHENVLTFAGKLKVGNSEGYIHIALPTVALKPIINRFSPSNAQQQQQKVIDTPSATRLFELMRDVNVTMTAELRGTNLTVDELLDLTEGDILRLDQRLTVPASVSVNNCQKFAGTLGARQGSRMISISERTV